MDRGIVQDFTTSKTLLLGTFCQSNISPVQSADTSDGEVRISFRERQVVWFEFRGGTNLATMDRQATSEGIRVGCSNVVCERSNI